MTNVRLDYDADQEILEIRGLSKGNIEHPFLAAYLRQTDAINHSEFVGIGTPADALSTRYQTVHKLLQRIGIEITESDHVSDVLGRVQQEEAEFEEFSKKADSIWHSDIETEEFREFVSVIKEHCPGRTFYKKQILAAYHLAFAHSACNFSVPGAGKTSIVYSAYAYLRSLPEADARSVQRLLIVGPKASFKAWDDEYLEIFGRSAESFRIFGEISKEDRSDYLRGVSINSRDTELTLTSYATLASSEDEFRTFLLNSSKRTMVVLDEAHYIKRQDGFWSAAALRLAPLASSRVVLTGTPAPNGYEDLGNLFKFIYPTKNIVGFPPATLAAITNGSMPQAIPKIKSQIRPFYTRIRKSDLNLPKATEEPVPVALGELQNQIYRALERRIISSFHADPEIQSGGVRLRSRLIRLRQACVNPELLLRPLEEEGIFDTSEIGDLNLAESEVADLIEKFEPETHLERLTVCKQLVHNILESQGKVLIWSYFLGNIDLLKKVFSNTAEFVEVLTGSTPISGQEDDSYDLGSREEIIDRFHTCEGSAVMIANPQAVGESISLHKACRSAIYFDRDFNAGRFIQSKDRIHRYNPKGGKPVSYYYLNASGTVDDDINARLATKEKRLTDLLESEEIPLFSALGDAENRDDLNAILESYERRKTQ